MLYGMEHRKAARRESGSSPEKFAGEVEPSWKRQRGRSEGDGRLPRRERRTRTSQSGKSAAYALGERTGSADRGRGGARSESNFCSDTRLWW